MFFFFFLCPLFVAAFDLYLDSIYYQSSKFIIFRLWQMTSTCVILIPKPGQLVVFVFNWNCPDLPANSSMEHNIVQLTHSSIILYASQVLINDSWEHSTCISTDCVLITNDIFKLTCYRSAIFIRNLGNIPPHNSFDTQTDGFKRECCIAWNPRWLLLVSRSRWHRSRRMKRNT